MSIRERRPRWRLAAGFAAGAAGVVLAVALGLLWVLSDFTANDDFAEAVFAARSVFSVGLAALVTAVSVVLMSCSVLLIFSGQPVRRGRT